MYICIPQKSRMGQAGRDYWGSPSATFLLGQQQSRQNHGRKGFLLDFTANLLLALPVE